MAEYKVVVYTDNGRKRVLLEDVVDTSDAHMALDAVLGKQLLPDTFRIHRISVVPVDKEGNTREVSGFDMPGRRPREGGS